MLCNKDAIAVHHTKRIQIFDCLNGISILSHDQDSGAPLASESRRQSTYESPRIRMKISRTRNKIH